MAQDNEHNSDEYSLKSPSELGLAAVAYIEEDKLSSQPLRILDIGCGNGRDALYVVEHLNCSVLGIDSSEEAIEIASSTALETQREKVQFRCCDFRELKGDEYDIVLSSGVYHFLNKNERRLFRGTVMRLLKPHGLLFLSTLSVGDTEYYGKGKPLPEEPNSFLYEYSPGKRVYLHFCTREELVVDFTFIDIKELYEHEQYDPRVKGPINYIPWILIGNMLTRYRTG